MGSRGISRRIAPLVSALAICAPTVAQPVAVPSIRFSPAQVVEQVARCGVLPARVSIRDDRELEEEVITIAAGPPPDDTQLACVARISLAAATYVEFNGPEQQARYDRVYRPLEKAQGTADARAWLIRRGWLDKLPSFDPQRQALGAYGRELEAFCGIASGSFLTSVGSTLTIRHDLLTLPVTAKPFGGAVTDEQFECLLNASAASNLGEHGAGFGFIGNEALGR